MFWGPSKAAGSFFGLISWAFSSMDGDVYGVFNCFAVQTIRSSMRCTRSHSLPDASNRVCGFRRHSSQSIATMSDDYDSQVSSLTAHFTSLFAYPPAEVSSTIKASPLLGACSEALAVSLLSSAQANPTSIDALVQPLVRELATTEDLRFTDEEAGYIDTPFNTIFQTDLAEHLSNALHETQLHKPKQTDVIPRNTVLSSALLAGSALRNGLLSSKAIYAFAGQGLQLSGATIEEERKEVVAIGACLLLLVAGDVLLDKWMSESDRLEKVVKALESLKERKITEYPTAVSLLEKTIVAAKNGFTTVTPTADAWKLLFP